MSTQNSGIGDIKFVVGLREGANADKLIERVFPLTKIIPVEIKEKKPKKKPKKIEEKICSRPDCAARKDKLTELKDENKLLRLKVKAIESRVEATKNKIALTEKSIIMAEEKNDTLNGEIEEAQNRIISVEQDVEKAESFNQTLRRQLASVQQEIDQINAQTVEQQRQFQELMEDKAERQIVFAKPSLHHNRANHPFVSEVSCLKFPNDGDDSD
jgi:chromosome segregation ATPase